MSKSVLISGGGRGIGRALALEFARGGYCVTVMARSEDELTETVQEIQQCGSKALAIIGDVTIESDADAAVRKVVESFGNLDVLINNAGIFRTSPLVETSTEVWQRVLAVNLTGAFFLTRAACRQMIQQGTEGFIVNISSVAGKEGFPGSAAYCASKFGLVGFSAAIREELRGSGIRVMTVCPGQVDTKAWDTCGLDLESLGIKREQMMTCADVAKSVTHAVLHSGTAFPEELILRPLTGG